MICGSLLTAALATAYEPSRKEIGKKWEVKFNGRSVTGDSTDKEYVWMADLSGRSKAKAIIGLWGKKEDGGIDGAVGLLDATPNSFLASLLYESSMDGSVQHYGIHFGNGKTSDGNFQFHGIDTGTFEEPVWYPLPSQCTSPESKCYHQIFVSRLLINQESIGDNVHFVLSTEPTIKLPAALYSEYQKKAKEGVVNFEFQFVGEKGTLHSVAIDIDKVSVSSGEVAIFGAPIFEQLNVVFELNARGQRSKVGFAPVRKEVYSSEEFLGNPITKALGENAYVMTLGIGGPWGPVQTDFDVIIGVQWSGILIREGTHDGPSYTRPYVGSFMQCVVLLLCVCPVGIFMFLRKVNAAVTAELNVDSELEELKVAPRSDGLNSPTRSS
eukprot:TRINITY_DN14403_c0_g1_i1.p1 TRINITY_DN14403_c0_g1~~TRINITY_DN14403_c0_g1_i1.p1  ORF type:complete len:383 (+),score=67.94 TRINITY_DN14403_c0_g1_i1:162-1310(+)